MRILRRLALAILASELREREAHAEQLAVAQYDRGGNVTRRARSFWIGYGAAIVAIRQSRDSL